MTEEPRDPPSFARRRKRRQSRARQAIASIWPEWHVEILVAILVSVTIFLLVERIHIRQALLDVLRQGLQGVSDLGGAVLQALANFVRNTTLSDMTAYLLLLVALVFAALRARWRLMTLPRFRTRECPRCGGELHRIRRHGADRLVNLYVPVRRYQCKNRDCRWQGLRVGRTQQG
jgi:hypothetical protein